MTGLSHTWDKAAVQRQPEKLAVGKKSLGLGKVSVDKKSPTNNYNFNYSFRIYKKLSSPQTLLTYYSLRTSVQACSRCLFSNSVRHREANFIFVIWFHAMLKEAIYYFILCLFGSPNNLLRREINFVIVLHLVLLSLP